MAIVTIHSTVSYRSLAKRSKARLRDRIYLLADVLGEEKPAFADLDKMSQRELADMAWKMHQRIPEET